MSEKALRLVVLLLLTAALAGTFALAADAPRRSSLTETAEVRRVQVDVTVLDPRGRGSRPVTDLRKEDFVLLLDGKPLTEEQFAAVEFDRICGESSILGPLVRDTSLPGEAASLLVPRLVVFVDLNFLDTAARHRVHRALLSLADRAAREPLRVRVFAYGRRLVPLAPGFTGDPAVIRAAADALLGTPAAGPPLGEATDVPGVGERPADPLLTGEGTEIFRVIQEEGSYLEGEGVLGEMLLADDLRPDPQRSIAAIRQVLLAHAGLPGRKGLVVFTSPWFDLPRDLQLEAMNSLHRAAQAGFSIYMVDARGLSHGGEESTLMSWLANTTGGQVVRLAGDLDIAFQRVLAQLDCYYLFSVPVPAPAKGSEAHNVVVKLDTTAHPEFWRYRVHHRATVYVDAPATRGIQRRLEALLDPLSHPHPEVRLEATWPSPPDRRTAVEIAVRLADVSFLPVEGGGVAARIAVEGLVARPDGSPVCVLGDRRVHEVRLPRAPGPAAPARLVVRQACSVPGPGRYEVRVAVHDLQDDRVGAALATIDVADPRGRAAPVLPVSGVRLGFNSGGEFLLDVAPGRPAAPVAPRDVRRAAFVPVRGEEPLPPGSRVSLRFVACGSEHPPRAILFRREAGSPPRVRSQVALHPRGPVDPETGCRELEAVIPGGALEPGAWGIALLPATGATGSREGIERALAAGEWLALRTFRLAAPGGAGTPGR